MIKILISILKFIYSEKATKFGEMFPLLLTAVHTVKSKGKISHNFVAFSEYMNFKNMKKQMNMGMFFLSDKILSNYIAWNWAGLD